MATRAEASAAVAGILDRFGGAIGGLSAAAELLQREGREIGEEVAEVLVALQFQDRVGQMLAHVHQDMAKLSHQIDGHNRLDVQEWLRDLAATYTTSEQHAVHQGRAECRTTTASDITFF